MGDYPLYHTHRQSLEADSGGAPHTTSFYVHFPYSTETPFIVRSSLPEGTLHLDLFDQLPFEPYPESFSVPHSQPPLRHGVRIFIGQLAYEMTDEQVEWLCARFGNGRVFNVERIIKRNATNGLRMPTGCVHAYCDPSIVGSMTRAMHKRLLIDTTGVWYARTEDEIEFLNNYCQQLRNSRRARNQHLPRDSVVVQYATSDFPPSGGSNRSPSGSNHPTPRPNYSQ